MRRISKVLAILIFAGILPALVIQSASGEEMKEPVQTYVVGSYVSSVSVSADGRYIATAGGGKVHLLDRHYGTPLWNYTIDEGVLYADISANGEYIVAAGYKKIDGNFYGTVYLFYRDNSTPLWNYTTKDIFWRVVISADGEYIAAGSNDGKIYLFNRDNSTPLWNSTVGRFDVRHIAISANGDYLAVGSPNHKVYLFHKDSRFPLWEYRTGDSIFAIAISADGEYIIAGNGMDDKKALLFHRSNNTPLWSFTLQGIVNSVAISANGERIVVSDSSRNLYLFSRESDVPLWNHSSENLFYSIGISADGEYITARNHERKIFRFHWDNSTPLWINITKNLTNAVTISADGRYIVVGDDSGRVYLFLNNAPPTAVIDVITPTYAKKGALMTLQGHGEDVDGTITAYAWSSSIDGNLSTDRYFSNSSLSVGYHTIYLKVRDNDGDWSEAASSWLRIYTAPEVMASENITVKAGDTVLFNGTGTDEDGAVAKYEWDFDGDGEYDWFSEDNGSTTFVYQQGGAYTAVLRVTDNDGFTATDKLTVTVLTLPRALFIDSLSPFPTAELGSLVTFGGFGRDDDGNITAFAWNSSIDGPLSDEPTFETAALSLGRHTIYLRVRDDDGLWSEAVSSTLWIYASPIANAGEDTTAQTGERVSFNGTGTDEDGSILNYKWDFDGDGVFDRTSAKGVATYVYKEEGEYIAVLKVTDNNGFMGTDSRVINVTKKAKPEIDDGGIPSPSLTTVILLTVIVALLRRPPGSRT